MASWLSPSKRRHISVSAEKGTLVFDDTAARKLTLYDVTGEVSYPAYTADPPLTIELQAFCDTIRGGTQDRDHIGDGVAIVRAIAAAARSVEGDGVRVLL